VLFPDGKVLRWEHDDAGLEVAQYVDDALLARIDRDPRTRTVTMTDHTLLPAFTHGLPETGDVRVTDFSGNRERLATLEESNAVPHMITRSPLLLEKAVRAHAGLEPWLAALDGIRYKKRLLLQNSSVHDLDGSFRSSDMRHQMSEMCYMRAGGDPR
jgi:hypothetical protein